MTAISTSLKQSPRRHPLTTAIALTAIGSSASLSVYSQDYALEEVVVTAQKRSESTQDIGASVTAVTGDALQDMNAFSFEEVAKMTSGLSLENNNPRLQTISMRGVSYDPEGTANATVDSYWNGMSVRPDVIFSQMFDVERMEILRGPQGTLQGKTSPAGAITMVTRGPDMHEVEGQVQTSLTENGETNTQFGVSVPLIPGELSMRISGLYNESELQNNENITTGKDDSGRDKAGRVTLAWEPGDTFSASLAMEYSEQNFRASEDVVYTGSGDGSHHNKYDGIAMAAGDNSFVKRNKLAVLNMDWDVSDNLRLSSVTGLQDNYSRDVRDLDYANESTNPITGQPNNASQWQTAEIETEQFSQELRLSNIEPQFWEYIVGVYYEQREMNTNFYRDLTASGMPLQMRAEDIPSNREEWGVFSHNTFNLTDFTRLQAGVRWQQVRSHYRYDYGTYLGDMPIFEDEVINNDLARQTTDAVTGTLKLMHDLSDDVMVYASYDRGFRPGGVGIDPALTNSDDLVYDDETSDSFEVGIKSMLFDNRLQLNTALYHQRYDGYINRVGNITIDNGLGSGTSQASGIMFNGDAIVQGIDVDFTAMLSEHWTLGGGVSYVDAKYDDAEVPCNAGTPGSSDPTGDGQVSTCISDGRVAGEPNWSANLNTEYLIPLGDLDMFTRAVYKFTGSSTNDFQANSEIGSYGTTDLVVGVRDASRSWEASVWAKNVFDKQTETEYLPNHMVGDLSGQVSDYRRVNVLQERTIGVTGKYYF